MSEKQLLLMPYLGAVLLSLPFLHVSLSPLIFVGFVPFFIYLEAIRKKPTKYAYLNLYFAGFIQTGAVLSWQLTTSPARWIPMSEAQGVLVAFVSWFIGTLVMSSFYVFFIIGLKYLNRHKLTTLEWTILVITLWGICEFLRASFASLAAIGEDSVFGSLINYGALGYGAILSPLGYASRFVGLYGLSCLVLIVNLAVLQLWRRDYKHAAIFASPLIFLALLGYLIYQPNGAVKDVAVLHIGASNTDVEHDISAQELETIFSGVNADLLVMPEYIDPAGKSDEKNDVVSSHVQDGGTQVGGRRARDTYPSENLLVYRDSTGQEIATYPKWFIVPYGEYLPYVIDGYLTLTKQTELLERFNTERQVIGGEYNVPVVRGIGGHVCSGILAPNLYHASARNGAVILTNSASLGIFAFSPIYHQQAHQMAKYHAVSNARPFAQATRSGESMIINANGSALVADQSLETTVLNAQVQTNSKKTLASLLGSYVVLVLFIPGIVIAAKRRRAQD